MIKRIFILVLLACSSLSVKADSTFLSGLEFEYLYEDEEIFKNTFENGISKEEYTDFLLSSKNTLGQKIALIGALSSHYEFRKYRDDENYKYKGDEILFIEFREFTAYFETQVSLRYKVFSMSSDGLPNAIKLLHMLMEDCANTNPNVEGYKTMADKMPNSLVAQSIKVISAAYYIVYNFTDEVQHTKVEDYMDDYVEPYKLIWDKCEADIRPTVYNKVMSWEQFMLD